MRSLSSAPQKRGSEEHAEREDVDAILSGLFDMNRKLARIDRNLEVITSWLENGARMKKKRKRIRPDLPPDEQHERTQKLLADRIAYHRAKIEEERALREREAS